jgi:hypothetical protein
MVEDMLAAAWVNRWRLSREPARACEGIVRESGVGAALRVRDPMFQVRIAIDLDHHRAAHPGSHRCAMLGVHRLRVVHLPGDFGNIGGANSMRLLRLYDRN